jgi:Flp pilus assembly protein TadG
MRRRPFIANRRRAPREGAAAVEFAMVGLPFLFMMFAILELGLVFVVDSVLENAVIETGRLVRTGEAQNQGLTAATFKTRLCARMSIFQSSCASQASVDVREIPQFDDPNVPDPTAGGSFSPAGLNYDDGGPGSLMLVRVWYRQPLVTPFLQQGLSRLNDGKAMMTATTAFRNEPFD